MQFRFVESKKGDHHNKWELIRWTYNSEKKRSQKELIGSFECYFSSVPAPILERCTPLEREDVKHWWTTLKEGERAEREQHRLNNLGNDIASISAFLDTVDASKEILEVCNKEVTSLKSKITKLLQAKKAEHKAKGKQSKKVEPVAGNMQPENQVHNSENVENVQSETSEPISADDTQKGEVIQIPDFLKSR